MAWTAIRGSHARSSLMARCLCARNRRSLSMACSNTNRLPVQDQRRGVLTLFSFAAGEKDAFVQLAGYARKSAIRALGQAPRKPGVPATWIIHSRKWIISTRFQTHLFEKV